MSRQRRGHVLATILYTDIVGSSHLASELGDRRWRAVLARHHLIVRRELKRHRGREIDNAGDGFLASFGDQESAVRCACAIVERVRELGLEVRAGLHVGQAEILGRKLGGIVLNTGARVLSEAGPGEVLVTAMLKDLLPGSELSFENVGERELKGIEGRWRLFAVTAVDGKPVAHPLDVAEAEARLASIKPPPIVQRRWGRVAIASLALVLAAATAVIVASREPPIEIRPNSLLRIDPESGEIVADVPFGEPPGSIPITVQNDEIWLIGRSSKAIIVVDATTNEVVGSFKPPAEAAAAGLAYLDGSVWITADEAQSVIGPDAIVRFTPSTHLAQRTIPLPKPPRFAPNAFEAVPQRAEHTLLLAADFEHVWVAAHDAARLYKIDPRSNRVTSSSRIGIGLNGMATGEGSVWVANYSSGTITKIDPDDGTSVPIKLSVRRKLGSNVYELLGGPSNIAVGFQSVWVTDTRHGVTYRLSPATGEIIDTIDIDRGTEGLGACSADCPSSTSSISGVAVTDDAVWVSTPGKNAIVRIDPATDRFETITTVPYSTGDVLVADGDVWVVISE